MIDQEDYINLIERITIIEAAYKHADEQRAEMAKDIRETKELVSNMVRAEELRSARFGGMLWAATAMASALSLVIKAVWEWLNRGG